MKFLVAMAACVFFTWLALLFFLQHKMIYRPRPYRDQPLPDDIQGLISQTSQGVQQAFLFPAGARTFRKLWLLFAGNAALALEWTSFVRRYPDHEAAFLLIEYPGYGNSAGQASPATIQENVDAALATLASQVTVDLATIPMGVIGHSLGAAVGLEFAARRPCRDIILIAPFTRMLDMARMAVGFPANLLLRHRFDNLQTLRIVLDQTPRPKVTIFHGDRDQVVPLTMGRQLAALAPDQISFQVQGGMDHNEILTVAEPKIFAAMVQQ